MPRSKSTRVPGEKRFLECARNVNATLSKGERVLVVPEELVRHVTKYLKQHWDISIRREVILVTSSLDNAEVLEGIPMDIANPFKSPKAVAGSIAATKAVLDCLEKILTMVENGGRTFTVPIGIAKRVAQAIRDTPTEEGESPWSVKVEACVDTLEHPYGSTSMRKLTISHPDDSLE